MVAERWIIPIGPIAFLVKERYNTSSFPRCSWTTQTESFLIDWYWWLLCVVVTLFANDDMSPNADAERAVSLHEILYLQNFWWIRQEVCRSWIQEKNLMNLKLLRPLLVVRRGFPNKHYLRKKTTSNLSLSKKSLHATHEQTVQCYLDAISE